MNNNYYKESGIAPPLNIALSIFCSIIVILFLSYFYSIIITYSPIIYLNFIVVVIYGISIAHVSKIFNTLFKIRNRKKTIIITIILSLLGLYFQWCSHLFIVLNDNFSLFMIFEKLGSFCKILFRPDLAILNIIEINKIGLWSIGFSGTPLNGIFLWFIWLFEAAIIVYLSYNNFINFNEVPFSEKDNNWFKKEIVDFDFERITFKNDFIKEFEKDPFIAINNLKKGDGLRHSKIHLFKSETETKSIVSIDNIIVGHNGRGKKEITNVIKHCYIDNIYLNQITTKYQSKKISGFVY